MSKNDIVTELASKRMVEEIISNISKGTFPDTDDLAQDIYVALLNKPEEKLQQLYTNKQMNYFVTVMVRNNLMSMNSPYYYNYMRYHQNRSEFINKEDLLDDDDTTDL